MNIHRCLLKTHRDTPQNPRWRRARFRSREAVAPGYLRSRPPTTSRRATPATASIMIEAPPTVTRRFYHQHPRSLPSPAGQSQSLRLQMSDNPAVTLGGSQTATTTTDSKPDSAPENLPMARSPPSSEPENTIAPPPATVPRRERNVSGWRSRGRARRLMVEEGGGVCLDGGPLEDSGREEDDSGGWEVLPPPCHHFR